MIGANGAGKTTLLRCLASIVRPTAGEVRWFGNAVKSTAARRLIGMVAHESHLYPHLTLRENLVFAARMCGVSEPAHRANQLLGRTALSSYAELWPTQVSAGIRHRAAIARALVHDPPILLLDEPFSCLDAQGSQWLLEMLLDFRKSGRTICFATHDETKTDRLAERVLELRSGQLHEADPNVDATKPAAAVWARAA